MDPIELLTYIGIVLFIGLLCSIIAKKVRIPSMLFLIIAGLVLQHITYKGAKIIDFPPIFLTSIGLLALIMIVFDSTSTLKPKEFDNFSFAALKVTGIFLILSLTLLTFSTHVFFKTTISVSLIFASIMVGTAPSITLVLLQGSKNKFIEFLKIESVLNTPITVILPFVLIDFMQSMESKVLISTFLDQINPFLLQLVAGMGSGLFIGLIIFKIMRKQYSEKFSPIAILVAALLAFVMAENLGGNGVLSVTTLGLVFGSVTLKEKESLKDFSSILTNSLEIMVFLLVGFIIAIPLTKEFILKSLLLFLIYLFIRLVSIEFSFRHQFVSSGRPNLRQKFFLTLNSPKGITTATVVFLLATYQFEGLTTALDLTLAFVLYSIVLSSVTSKFYHFFLRGTGEEA